MSKTQLRGYESFLKNCNSEKLLIMDAADITITKFKELFKEKKCFDKLVTRNNFVAKEIPNLLLAVRKWFSKLSDGEVDAIIFDLVKYALDENAYSEVLGPFLVGCKMLIKLEIGSLKNSLKEFLPSDVAYDLIG